MKMGRLEDAEPVLRRAYDISESLHDPDQMKYKVQLALCLEQLGEKDNAKATESLKLLREIQVERQRTNPSRVRLKKCSVSWCKPTTKKGPKNQ